MTRFIGLILTYSLFLMLLISLSFAQEDSPEPFGELEEEIVEVEKKIKTPKPGVEYKNVKNPRTYLSANKYALRGIILYPKKSYAILGTEDIIDQVMEIGNQLGIEGWQILTIHKESIVVGNPQNADEKITIHITN